MSSVRVSHETLTTLRAKVVVVGDACVGKTAICKVAANTPTEFPKNYVMTTVIDLHVKTVRIKDAATPTQVELLLLDTPGSSTFNQRETGSAAWAAANLVALVFDVTSRDSLQSCAKWLRRFLDSRAMSTAGAAAGVPRGAVRGVLIGNKGDLREEERGEVSPAEARAFAESAGLAYFEVSAEMGGLTLDEPFLHIAKQFHKSFLAEVEAAADL